MVALRLLVLLGLCALSSAKDVIVADLAPDPELVFIEDITTKPKITKASKLAGTEGGGYVYIAACSDRAKKLVHYAVGKRVGAGISGYIYTFNVQTWKNTTRSPMYTLPDLIGATHCNVKANSMVFALASSTHKVTVVSVSISSGKTTTHGSVQFQKHKVGFGFGDSAFDETTQTLAWDWDFAMAPPYYGNMIIASLTTNKVRADKYTYGASVFEEPAFGPHGNLWGTNLTFNGPPAPRHTIHQDRCIHSADSVTSHHLHRACRYNDIEAINKTEIDFYRTLTTWDVKTDKRKAVGKGRDTSKSTVWAVPAKVDLAATAYTTLSSPSGGGAFVRYWSVSTGETKDTSTVAGMGGGSWLGPYTFFDFFQV